MATKKKVKNFEWKIMRRRFCLKESLPDMWHYKSTRTRGRALSDFRSNTLQIARFFKNEAERFPRGYYISRYRWSGWLGPLPSLAIAKNAALYLQQEEPSVSQLIKP